MPVLRTPRHNTRQKLSTMTRPELQKIAKEGRIPANGKKDQIIQRILTKYPNGLPSQSESSSSKIRNSPRCTAKVKTTPLVLKPDPDAASSPLTQLSSSNNDDERRGSEDFTPDPPSEKYLRVAARELVKYANTRGALVTRIEETNALLDYAKRLSRHIDDNLAGAVCYRMTLEDTLLPAWKVNPFLWNGVGLLEGEEGKQERAVWKEWLT